MKNSENAIFEKVLANTKVDIQDSMIERESQSLLEEYKQRLASQGYKWEDAIKNESERMALQMKHQILVTNHSFV